MITIKGKSLQRTRTGLITLRLRYLADTEDEALFDLPQSYRGLIADNINGATWSANDDKWLVDVTYQGLAAGDPSTDLDQYSIQGEYREEPIESFPDQAYLKNNYQAYIDGADGRLKFPETLSRSKNSSFSSNKKATGKNPLFGLTSYPVCYEIASHTYVRSSVPSSVHKKKGTVIASLPSGFEYDGDSKAWFVDAPLINKTGNAWSITERYKEIDDLPHLIGLFSILKK
jgi:hypothetical protein